MSYKLERNSLIVSYKVINKSDEKMLFSIGAHPAFNWSLEKDLKKEDYFLEFEINNSKRYFLNELGLVFDSIDLKFEDKKLFLNEELFKNDALVFNDLNIKNLTFKNIRNENFIKLNFENLSLFF